MMKNPSYAMMRNGFIIFVIILLFSTQVFADTGPHTPASLNFFVTYNNQTIADNFRADIITCRQENCEQPDNTAKCTQGACSFYYYRIERVPSTMKLQITLKDEVFTSDLFDFSSRKSPRESYYAVNINQNGQMIISDDNGEIKQYKEGTIEKINTLPSSQQSYQLLFSFAYAIIVTIIIELAVLIIFLKKWKVKKWKKPILTIVFANIISLPIVWTIILSTITVFSSQFIAILTGEAFAIIFETYFIHWLNKKIIPLRKAVILSTTMNITSFVIGGIILALL